jgi:hypothetical protein
VSFGSLGAFSTRSGSLAKFTAIRRASSLKRPTESDFEINVTGGGVEVIFKPTKSHYSYNRLVDQKDIARFGPISAARVRHAGATGDTGDYSSHDVEALALRLAADAARRGGSR